VFHWCKLTLEFQSDVIDDCKGSLYGCCPDGITIATTADLFGCPGKYSELYRRNHFSLLKKRKTTELSQVTDTLYHIMLHRTGISLLW